ncbi:hypothetical protein SDC9_125371 [bioreactor metagenome]|uniref:Uncharacterized protein n=1 Tax=bioreactor metagenome TaxID=1076179 RepID=A0A645CMS4_9ZZZZ
MRNQINVCHGCVNLIDVTGAIRLPPGAVRNSTEVLVILDITGSLLFVNKIGSMITELIFRGIGICQKACLCSSIMLLDHLSIGIPIAILGMLCIIF